MNVETSSPIAVVGALNLDLCGTPLRTLRARDSNPGKITLSPGGVGHNIAWQLARGGLSVELLTAIGDDEKATLIEFYCQKERIGLTHALRLPGASSAYLCVHDENGDMIIAINDMALMDALPSDPPEAWLSIIQHSPLAILDANLPVPLFEAIVYAAKAPLLLDPVSTFKAERARRVIGRFAAVKPNRLEAKQLSGEDDPIKAAKWFHAQGVQKVFISLGADGVYFSDEGTQGILLAPQVAASDYTGAGDAMTGGIAYGMLMGHNAKGCALSGMEAVSDHLQSHR